MPLALPAALGIVSDVVGGAAIAERPVRVAADVAPFLALVFPREASAVAPTRLGTPIWLLIEVADWFIDAIALVDDLSTAVFAMTGGRVPDRGCATGTTDPALEEDPPSEPPPSTARFAGFNRAELPALGLDLCDPPTFADCRFGEGCRLPPDTRLGTDPLMDLKLIRISIPHRP